MKRLTFILLTIAIACCASAQNEYLDITKGNRNYNDSAYTEAEVAYRKAIDKNNQSYTAHYNLGNTLVRQEKYDEAIKEYYSAINLTKDKDALKQATEKELKAQNYHNIGNCYFAKQQYNEAIEAYKEALRNNPTDNDTRYNLVKAKEMLKQQQQEQNQEQQQQQQQQQEQQQQEQNQEQQQQQQEQEQQEQEQQEQEAQAGEMTKEQAEQLLEAFEQDEKETQNKVMQKQMQKQNDKRVRTEKDW